MDEPSFSLNSEASEAVRGHSRVGALGGGVLLKNTGNSVLSSLPKGGGLTQTEAVKPIRTHIMKLIPGINCVCARRCRRAILPKFGGRGEEIHAREGHGGQKDN